MLSCLLTAALLLAAPAPIPEVKSPAKEVVALPIREVTVFSDRARVTRRGELAFVAQTATRIALLPPTLDPESVRLESDNAIVERVEVRRASEGEFPRTEAEALVKELEAAREVETTLSQKRQALDHERNLLFGIRPTTSPQSDPKSAPVLLEPAGWKASLSFLDSREASLEESLRGVDEKLLAQRKKTTQLCGRAALLAAGNNASPGYVVEAWLEGKGGARLALTYVALNARWYPAYDVRFNPGKAEVEVGFAALASQQTGEDWIDAKLVFSTAVPATTATLPKLMAWKIGDRDRFIPTPVARPETIPPAPPAPSLEGLRERADHDNSLRRRLMELAQSEIAAGDQLQGLLQAPRGAVAAAPPPAEPEEIAEEKEVMKREYDRPSAPPPPSAPPARSRGALAQNFKSEPAPTSSTIALGGLPGGSAYRPSNGISLSGPFGWTSPSFAGDLPAALAGGYDFVYPSARPESIRSGPENRRVALHTTKLPAEARLAIFPALRKHAYLVADVTNSSERPLLQGNANLFVGADLQGQARLATTAAGEKLTLPLGIDEGVQIERNVNVITREKGLVSKDDVTTYEVVIELVNPRATPVQARIVDQVPLTGEKTVEVKFDRMDPWAILDKDEGSLEWRLTLPPAAKQVIKFAYTVTRPRGAKLRQW